MKQVLVLLGIISLVAGCRADPQVPWEPLVFLAGFILLIFGFTRSDKKDRRAFVGLAWVLWGVYFALLSKYADQIMASAGALMANWAFWFLVLGVTLALIGIFYAVGWLEAEADQSVQTKPVPVATPNSRMYYWRWHGNSYTMSPWPVDNLGRIPIQEAWGVDSKDRFHHYVSFDDGFTWYDMNRLLDIKEQGSFESARVSEEDAAPVVSEFRRIADAPPSGM